jgi:hypothetical protein
LHQTLYLRPFWLSFHRTQVLTIFFRSFAFLDFSTLPTKPRSRKPNSYNVFLPFHPLLPFTPSRPRYPRPYTPFLYRLLPNNLPGRRHSRLASRPRRLVRLERLHRSLQHNRRLEHCDLLLCPYRLLPFISGLDIFDLRFCGVECGCLGRSLFRCFRSSDAFACGDLLYGSGNDGFEFLLW